MKGILGGCGAYASAELYRRTLTITAAQKDSDFPELLVYNMPSKHLGSARKASPELLFETLKGLKVLKQAGCTEVWIACISLHALLPQIEQVYPGFVKSRVPNVPNGSLVVCSKITRDAQLFGSNVTYVAEEAEQLIYNLAMYGYGLAGIVMLKAITKRHLEYIRPALVLGCTELSLLNGNKQFAEAFKHITTIDPLSNMALEIAA